MRQQAIKDETFERRYQWQPPRIVDRSEPPSGDPQQPLPGLGGYGHVRPGQEGVSHRSDLWLQKHNPHVWGVLANPGVHNPFTSGHFDKDHKDDLNDGWHTQPGWDSENRKLARKVAKHLQKTVSKGHPCVAASTDSLHQILSDGRIKSQFETGTSGGYLGRNLRVASENRNFGYPPNRDGNVRDYSDDDYNGNSKADHTKNYDFNEHPPHARPIYGYLAHDPFQNQSSHQYGNHTLVMKKPKVWHRTSTTMYDSLGQESSQRPTPVQKVHLDSASPERAGQTHLDRMLQGDHTSLGNRLRYHLGHTLDNKYDHSGYGLSYTEAQYHGGLSTNDIHYAVLRPDYWDEDEGHGIKEHLNDKGVPWVHIHNDGYGENGVTVADHNHHEALLRHAVNYQVMLAAAVEGKGMEPKIIAKRDGGFYLLDLGNGDGQIANVKTGILYPPKFLGAILARGYWHECDDVDAADILHLVKPLAS